MQNNTRARSELIFDLALYLIVQNIVLFITKMVKLKIIIKMWPRRVKDVF